MDKLRLMSKARFAELTRDKQWNYIQYLQARRTNVYFYITNNAIISISLFSLFFAAMNLFDFQLEGLLRVVVLGFMLILFSFVFVKVLKKYIRVLRLKDEVLKMTRIYFSGE